MFRTATVPITVFFIQAMFGAVPDTIAKITKSEDGVVEVRNTGSKPITAVFVRRIDDVAHIRANVIWSDFYKTPLASGATWQLNGWRDAGPRDLQIDGVIFADGNALGGAVERGDGLDLVQSVFDRRKGEANEMAKWRFNLDHVDNIDQFISLIQQAPEIETIHDAEESGRAPALHEMKNQWVNWIQQHRDSGESDHAIREKLASTFDGRINQSMTASKRAQ